MALDYNHSLQAWAREISEGFGCLMYSPAPLFIWEASWYNMRSTGLRVKIPDCSQSVSAFYVQLRNSFGFSMKENIHQLLCYEMMLVKPCHKFQFLYSFLGLPFSLLPVWISSQTLGCKYLITFSFPSSIKMDSRPHVSGGQEIHHQHFGFLNAPLWALYSLDGRSQLTVTWRWHFWSGTCCLLVSQRMSVFHGCCPVLSASLWWRSPSPARMPGYCVVPPQWLVQPGVLSSWHTSFCRS